jgi:hypothetical protein
MIIMTRETGPRTEFFQCVLCLDMPGAVAIHSTNKRTGYAVTIKICDRCAIDIRAALRDLPLPRLSHEQRTGERDE